MEEKRADVTGKEVDRYSFFMLILYSHSFIAVCTATEMCETEGKVLLLDATILCAHLK